MASRAGVRYARDHAGRLILLDPADALHPTRILEGTFTTDRQNHVRVERNAAREAAMSGLIIFKYCDMLPVMGGKW